MRINHDIKLLSTADLVIRAVIKMVTYLYSDVLGNL